MAKTLEELPLYSKVLEFWNAVFAILRDSELRRNRRLFEQIDSANDSVEANLKEGFEQPTDAAFAKFAGIAKGSLEGHYRGRPLARSRSRTSPRQDDGRLHQVPQGLRLHRPRPPRRRPKASQTGLMRDTGFDPGFGTRIRDGFGTRIRDPGFGDQVSGISDEGSGISDEGFEQP